MADGTWQRSLEAGTKENVQLIYISYLLALAMGITALIGLVMAYTYRPESRGWVREHYTFLIRTFWLGLLHVAIGIALFPFLIGIPILMLAPIWWIVRCVQGLSYAAKHQPIPASQS